MNKVLKTTKFVVDNSQYVHIDETKIPDFCKRFTKAPMKHWFEDVPFDSSRLTDKEKLNFILVFHSMSFSFWGSPKWTIKYKGKEYDGSWGVVCALARAMEEKIPILDFKYLSAIEMKSLGNILRGNTEIPLLNKRLKHLQELGRVMLDNFHGDFNNLLKIANVDVLKVLDLIVTNFPTFDDSSIYNGKKVCFYKRAQLIISDIYQAFKGSGYGNFKNIHELTAGADYKLPQILRKYGILVYDKKLAKKIDTQQLIPKDSKEEVELRANTIWAVELIKRRLKKKFQNIDSIHVNDHIWLLSQTKSKDDKPYHLTRSTFY